MTAALVVLDRSDTVLVGLFAALLILATLTDHLVARRAR